MSTEVNTVIEPCPICLEPYTAIARKQITCNSCQNSACIKCIEKYLLNTIEDPHCVHCRNAWSRSFLNMICTKTFLNQTYFKYRQDILLNREKSFLPQLQIQAERESQARDLEKEDITLSKEYNEIMKEYQKRIQAIMQKRNELHRRIYRIRAGTTSTEDEKKDERARFVRRCTADGCKGFLSSVWKCGLCNNWVCPDCFEVKGLNKDTPHTCSPEAVETANLIKRDTKPCPSCGEIIMKTEGCDQMWCTSCHNPFSWRTGQIITSGIVHNPHYFQWLAKGGRELPRNPGDIPCGGLPSGYEIRRTLVNLPSASVEEFIHIYRICAHIIDVERHRYERHLDPLNNTDIAVKYLLNEASETEWKRTLAKREKHRQKSNEIRDILDAFNGAVIDLFRRITLGTKYTLKEGKELIDNLMVELNNLREFTCSALADVSRSFNCSVPLINDRWILRNGKPLSVRKSTKNTSSKGDRNKIITESESDSDTKSESESNSD